MKTIIAAVFMVSYSLASIGQSQPFDYFNLKSPGEKTELFAPDIVSLKNSKEKSLAISPNGDEVFFSGGQSWPMTKIMHVKKVNNKWTEPVVASFSTDCYATEPAFSPDGKYLYYSSSKGMKDIKQYSIWRVEKIGNEWSNPKKVIDITDANVWEFHPSVTKSGTVYFCYWDSLKQVGSIYKSKYSGGVYSKPEKVILPFGAQSSDTDPFVDPDENYLIISATGQNGYGGYDVYISYKKDDGSWLLPINFGDKYSTKDDDDSFDISPDGKFMFIYKQEDVYWTETKDIIEKLHKK
jgi:hypothetical protein